MKALNRQTAAHASRYPEKILQFGEGNFLRAFFDWMVDRMNKEAAFNAGVTVVQPIQQGMVVDLLNKQDCLYHLNLKGVKNGQPITETALIDCISVALNPYTDFGRYQKAIENPELRFIVSNTTEAGIAFNERDTLEMQPQSSFPGKVAALLYRRYQLFSGAAEKGLIIFCCELIDRNGDMLKNYVLDYARLWNLEQSFISWVESANIFCNTLVDRIVPGFPAATIDTVQQQLDYEDHLVVEAEYFHLWVIEGPPLLQDEFPARDIGLNVIFTDDMTPYRERKVRILNGLHTASFAVSLFFGLETVRESVEHAVVSKFMRELVFEEICPNIDMPEALLIEFANAVLERFHNPFIEHQWQSIALNAVSKWETRVLPSLLDHHKRTGQLPEKIVFSLAALIAYYRGELGGHSFEVQDSEEIMQVFKNAWALYDDNGSSPAPVVEVVLSSRLCWSYDLSSVAGLSERVSMHLLNILTHSRADSLPEIAVETLF